MSQLVPLYTGWGWWFAKDKFNMVDQSCLFCSRICFFDLPTSQYQVWWLNQLLTQPRQTNRNVNFVNFVAVQIWNSIQKQEILDKHTNTRHTHWIQIFMKHTCNLLNKTLKFIWYFHRKPYIVGVLHQNCVSGDAVRDKFYYPKDARRHSKTMQ